MNSSTNRDTAGRQAADERLERLLDEELRAMTQAPGIDLKARVMAALEAGEAGKRAPVRVPAWGLAFAGAAAIVLAVYLAWPSTDRSAQQAAARTPAPLSSSALPARTPAMVPPTTTLAAASRVTTTAAASRPRAGQRRSAVGFGADTVPLDLVASSTGPYLPGAPAGELGDPLQPLPAPPRIMFTPIQAAPPVSDIARPVTDFPADNPPPDAPSRTSGQSGGSRR